MRVFAAACPSCGMRYVVGRDAEFFLVAGLLEVGGGNGAMVGSSRRRRWR